MNLSMMIDYIRNAVMVALPIAGAMLLAWSLVSLYFDLQSNDRRKVLDRLAGKGASQKKNAEQSILRQVNTAGANVFEKIIHQFSVTAKVQKMLNQANLPWSAPRFLVNLVGIAVVTLVVMLALRQGKLLALGVAAAVFFLPLFVINVKRKRRINKLVLQLPDVFELISQALRAGHSLGSGIQLVGKQLPDPAGTEFARIFHEQNLGIKVEDAMRNMADRVDQLDVKLFVTAVLIQRQTGGDLAEVLGNIGNVIRDRIKVLGQVKALTAEGRLSGWVLCALPVLVFLLAWVLNPEYAGVLLHEQQGRIMLASAVVSQVMGMLMIRKIVNIKV